MLPFGNKIIQSLLQKKRTREDRLNNQFRKIKSKKVSYVSSIHRQQGMSMDDAENFITLHSNIMCCRPTSTILCRMYAGKREKIIINSNSPHIYWIFFINKQGNKMFSQEKVKIFKLVTTLIDLSHKNG